jgi:hypothetical protein
MVCAQINGQNYTCSDPQVAYRFALDQLNWIFGLNPFDACMLQGRGRNSPDYHQLWPNAPGGVCNGICAGLENEQDIEFCPENTPYYEQNAWRWAEQWIPHGAWLLLALGKLGLIKKSVSN